MQLASWAFDDVGRYGISKGSFEGDAEGSFKGDAEGSFKGDAEWFSEEGGCRIECYRYVVSLN